MARKAWEEKVKDAKPPWFTLQLMQKQKDHDEELRYLEKIKGMGVDLTKYMVSQVSTFPG